MAKRRRFQRTCLAFETLEPRTLLSAGPGGDWDLVQFAKALDQAGVRLFGAPWSAESTQQRELFDDGGWSLPFVDVTNPDRTLNQTGIDMNIQLDSLPTWVFPPTPAFPGGSQLDGVQSLETLSQRSGVEIPTSDTPSIAPIEDTLLLVGSPLHVPLDGYDPNGDALSYTVSSDNAFVTPVLLEGNRSMRIDVDDWGQMVYQLFEQRAPRPSGRVIELAQAGFYDGILFHRVIDGFMIQAGDPTGTGSGGSTLGNFDDQFHVDLQHNRDGVLSYAKSSDDTNDSQFFSTLDATRWLDFEHSVFGQLVEGFEVAREIGKTATGAGDRPVQDVTIRAVDIFEDAENAVVMLKADPAAVGQDATITVTATDAAGNQAQTSFHVNILADTPENGGANGGPFLEDIPGVATPENVAAQIQLAAVDVEGDPVYYDAASLGSVGYTLDVDHQSGLVTATPPDGFVGQMEVLVGVAAANGSDTGDDFDRQVVTVDVLGRPELDLLPVSDSGSHDDDNVTNATEMQLQVTGLADGATVQILQGGNQIGQGTAQGDSAVITTSGMAGRADGTYALTAVQTLYGVSSQESQPLQVTLDTTPPPGFTSAAPAAAVPGAALTYDAQNDEEGTAGFAYSLAVAPDGATIDPATGVVHWTPAANLAGTRNVRIDATDLAGNVTAQAFTIALLGRPTVDLLPASDSNVSDDNVTNVTNPGFRVSNVTTGALVQLRIGEAVIGQGMASGGSIDIATDYFATADDGVYAVAAVQTVGQMQSPLSDALDVTLDTTPPPAFTSDPPTKATAGVALQYDAQNPEEATTGVTYSLVGAPAGATIHEQTGVFTWTPTEAQAGSQYAFQVQAADAAGNTTSQPVGIEVAMPTGRIRLETTDAQGNPIDDVQSGSDFSLRVLVQDLRADAKGVFAAYLDIAYDDQRIAIVDQNGDGIRSVADLTFGSTFSNPVPIAHLDTDGLIEEVGNFGAGARPGSSEQLLVSIPMRAVDSGTAHFQARPPSAQDAEFLVHGLDERVPWDDVAIQSTSLVVRPGVVAVDDLWGGLDEDAPERLLDVLSNDFNQLGGELIVTSVGDPTGGGRVSIVDGGRALRYAAAENFLGEETFPYTISNGQASSTGTVTIQVSEPKNDPPTAVDDQFDVAAGSENNPLDVLANDSSDPDRDTSPETRRIVAVGSSGSGFDTNQGGRVEINRSGGVGFELLYTPPPDGFTGTDTFSYTISDRADDSGLTDTATVTVVVEEGPDVNDDTVTLVEDSGFTDIDALGNDRARRGGTLRIDRVGSVDGGTVPGTETGGMVVYDVANGTVQLPAGGKTLRYKPDADFFGTDTFTYTVIESEGGQAQGTVTVTVTGTNDPPTASDDRVNVTKDSDSNVVDVLANDGFLPDADETLIITGVALTSTDRGSEFSVAPNGQWIVYTPAGGFVGEEVFTYAITDRDDGTGLSRQATLTINVVPSKIEGQIRMGGDQAPIHGLELTYRRADSGAADQGATIQTASDGSFLAPAIPGTYELEADPPFLTPFKVEVTVASGGNATVTPPAIYREPKYVTIADYVVTSRDQSPFSPDHAILAAVVPAARAGAPGAQDWYSVEAGWGGYSELQVHLWADLSHITLYAVRDGARRVHSTFSARDPRLVRFLGQEGQARLIRIMANPASLPWQDDGVSGEGESVEDQPAAVTAAAAQPVRSPAPAVEPVAATLPIERAEGESLVASVPVVVSTAPMVEATQIPVAANPTTPAAPSAIAEIPAVATSVAVIPVSAAPAAAVSGPTSSGSTTPVVADPAGGEEADAVDGSAFWLPAERTGQPPTLSATSPATAAGGDLVRGSEPQPIHAALAEEAAAVIDDRDLFLIASASGDDEFAQAVDQVLTEDSGFFGSPLPPQ